MLNMGFGIGLLHRILSPVKPFPSPFLLADLFKMIRLIHAVLLSFGGCLQSAGDDCLRFLQDAPKMILSTEAFGVDLIDIFCP